VCGWCVLCVFPIFEGWFSSDTTAAQFLGEERVDEVLYLSAVFQLPMYVCEKGAWRRKDYNI
jgi:hypothetical protein